MFLGFMLVIGLGLLWASVGIVMSWVAISGSSPISFYAVGNWITAIFCWIFIADWDVLSIGLPPKFYSLLFWMVFAGVFNSVGQILIIMSMRHGHRGISWALIQIGMLVPFLTSILIWDEPLTLLGSAGMLCFLCAIFLMGKGKSRGESDSEEGFTWKWILLIAGSLLFLGLTQTFQSVSSHWGGWADEANLRVPFLATTCAVVNAILVVVMKQKFHVTTLKYATIWAVFATSSYMLMFSSLDTLSKYSMSGCVFPIGQSICMVCFTLYSGFILKEKFCTPVKLGLVCSLAGIVFLAVS